MIARLPLVDYIHNFRLWNCTCLASVNDNIICLRVANFKILVSINALVLTMPQATQLPQSSIDSQVKIIKNVASVPTSEFDRIGKDQVVANKRCITCT